MTSERDLQEENLIMILNKGNGPFAMRRTEGLTIKKLVKFHTAEHNRCMRKQGMKVDPSII